MVLKDGLEFFLLYTGLPAAPDKFSFQTAIEEEENEQAGKDQEIHQRDPPDQDVGLLLTEPPRGDADAQAVGRSKNNHGNDRQDPSRTTAKRSDRVA